MPKISVLIGTYNGEKSLSKTLDSLLLQTYQDFEIVICDDNSLDNTRDIIKRYCYSYPNKIKAAIMMRIFH